MRSKFRLGVILGLASTAIGATWLYVVFQATEAGESFVASAAPALAFLIVGLALLAIFLGRRRL